MAGEVVIESKLTMALTYLSGGAASLGERHPVKEVAADLAGEQPRLDRGLDTVPHLSWPCSHQHWIISKLFILYEYVRYRRIIIIRYQRSVTIPDKCTF